MILEEPKTIDEAVIQARTALQEIREAKHNLIGRLTRGAHVMMYASVVREHASRHLQAPDINRLIAGNHETQEQIDDLMDREQTILNGLRANQVYGDF